MVKKDENKKINDKEAKMKKEKSKKTKTITPKKKKETLKSSNNKIIKTDEKDIKKKKSKSMRKIILLIISIIIVIFIIGVVWFTLYSGVTKAQLIIESGTVQIKHAEGSWTSAENGMLLFESDSVKTGENTSASIVIFESSIIRLDSNTEITLEEILVEAGETSVKINQDEGRTWSTIRKISGIDDYEVQTPTAVASVRGTSYDTNIHSKDKTVVGVSSGVVYVLSILNGESIEVNEDESVTVEIGKPLEIEPFEKDEWVLLNEQKDEEFFSDSKLLEKVKEDLYDRLEPFRGDIKNIYRVTDEELDVLIDGYLLGYFDLPPDTPDWVRDIIELT